MPYQVIVTDHTRNPEDGRLSTLGEYQTWDEVVTLIRRIADDRWGEQDLKTEDPASGYFEIEGVRDVSFANRIVSQDRAGMVKGTIRGEFLIIPTVTKDDARTGDRE